MRGRNLTRPGWRSAGRNAKLRRPAIIALETLMIDLYAMGSPNVVKIYIALEEMALPYAVHPVDVFGEAQFSPEFLRLNPNAARRWAGRLKATVWRLCAETHGSRPGHNIHCD